ncbi:MAG TPA: DUF3413 domain-containing protein [Steroidobacter sp.]
MSYIETRNRLLRWWGWLLLATLGLLLLVSLRYFEVIDLDARPASLLFRASMLVAHFTLFSTVALLPVLALIVVWPRPLIAIPLGVLCAVASVAIVLIDTQVYQLYRFHVNAGVLNLLFGGAARETFVFSLAVYAQAALIAAAILAIFSFASGWLWRRVARPALQPLPMMAAGILTVALLSFHSIHIWADAAGYEPFLEQTEVLPMRYAATAKRLLRAHGVNLSRLQVADTHGAQEKRQLSYPLEPLTCRTPAKPPNLVVIAIDSWRFDEFNAQVTPNIDRFARHSARFMDHYSGGNATRIGLFSLFYSIPGTYWHRVLAARQGPVLIEHLAQLDYDVQVFRSAPLYSPEFDRTVFAPIDAVRMRSDGRGPAAWDRDLTNDFLAYLGNRSESAPFFALLFYDAPHSFDHPDDYPTPFEPAAPHVNYLQLRRDTDPLPLLNRYRNSLHYVDSLVGEALAALESRGLLANSVIIVTSDHGQEFNDNGQNYWGHASNFTRFQTGVPFLLYAPGLEPGVFEHRTTHFDVMPTVLRDYFGCDSRFSTYSVGHPLFQPGGREIIVMSEYADFAIMHGNRTAVVRKHGMEVRDEDYLKLQIRLAPEVIAAALEQQARFATGDLRPLERASKGVRQGAGTD